MCLYFLFCATYIEVIVSHHRLPGQRGQAGGEGGGGAVSEGNDAIGVGVEVLKEGVVVSFPGSAAVVQLACSWHASYPLQPSLICLMVQLNGLPSVFPPLVGFCVGLRRAPSRGRVEKSGRNVDSDGISGVAGLFATNRQEVVRARDGLGPGGRRFPVGRLGF